MTKDQKRKFKELEDEGENRLGELKDHLEGFNDQTQNLVYLIE